MASVQARREKVRDEGGILVEKDRVPKMATHFESLAGKAREDQVSSYGESESERKRREAGFVGKGGAGVKDEAAVVCWGTAQYTLEKVAEATKAVADMTSSVAGYTGEKTVVVKDKVASAGMTVVEKIAATTDALVTAEEKVAEYAARKQKEARTEVEARRALHSHEIVEESKEASGVFVEEEEEGSILGAIGETIVEIGQTAKSFLLGLNPIQQKDEANSGRSIN